MALSFGNTNGLNELQLQELERIFPHPLPQELKTFFTHYGNSRPKLNNTACCFKITHTDGWETSAAVEKIYSFDGLKNVLAEMDYLEDYVDWFSLSADDVEAEFLFPVAETTNGVLFMATGGRHAGKIYVADSGDFGIVYQCESLQAFWENVYEEA